MHHHPAASHGKTRPVATFTGTPEETTSFWAFLEELLDLEREERRASEEDNTETLGIEGR